jgi:hypothetical protein
MTNDNTFTPCRPYGARIWREQATNVRAEPGFILAHGTSAESSRAASRSWSESSVVFGSATRAAA